MNAQEYTRMSDTILTLEPVEVRTRRGLIGSRAVGWSDNLRALWMVPNNQALDTDDGARPYSVVHAAEWRRMARVVDMFEQDNPGADLSVFTEAGAPADVAVATVKAFRDWKASPAFARYLDA